MTQLEAWRRRRKQVQVNPSGASRAAFLVGCNRSGTNMLVFGLGNSPYVELRNEDDAESFEEWYLRDLSVLRAIVDRSPASIVLFKPILETSRTRALLDEFPSSRALFAFRHYDDVANSLVSKAIRDGHPGHEKLLMSSWQEGRSVAFRGFPPSPESLEAIRSVWRPDLNDESGAALYWYLYNRFYFDYDMGKDDRILMIQYEAAVTDKEKVFEGVCEHLGLEFDPRLIADFRTSSVRKSDAPPLDPAVRALCEELWTKMCAAWKAQKGRIEA